MARKSEPSYITERGTFQTRLRELMKQQGTTQKELAKVVEMRPQTVSLYVTGQSVPDINTLKRISIFFNVSADYLLGLSDVATPATDLKGVCDYTGLSEKSVDNIRRINYQDLDDGLNLVLEGSHFIEVVRYAADLLRRCKYIAEGNARFQEMEDKAKAIQKENPELTVFYGREMLEYDISEAEKGLRNLLLFDSGYLLSDINERLWKWEAAENGERKEN